MPRMTTTVIVTSHYCPQCTLIFRNVVVVLRMSCLDVRMSCFSCTYVLFFVHGMLKRKQVNKLVRELYLLEIDRKTRI